MAIKARGKNPHLYRKLGNERAKSNAPNDSKRSSKSVFRSVSLEIFKLKDMAHLYWIFSYEYILYCIFSKE